MCVVLGRLLGDRAQPRTWRRSLESKRARPLLAFKSKLPSMKAGIFGSTRKARYLWRSKLARIVLHLGVNSLTGSSQLSSKLPACSPAMRAGRVSVNSDALARPAFLPVAIVNGT
jgi:hypothetical protein